MAQVALGREGKEEAIKRRGEEIEKSRQGRGEREGKKRGEGGKGRVIGGNGGDGGEGKVG